MDPQVLAIIRATNPWLERPRAFGAHLDQKLAASEWIPRTVPAMSDWPVAGTAHLLVGARQVGKSSHLLRWLGRVGPPPLVLNAEEPTIRAWLGSPALVLDGVRSVVTADRPVVIEEAQHVADAGLLTKGLIDYGLPNALYVTGSSSFHLLSKTRESLAGRAARALMHPLSLAELSGRHAHFPPALRAARVADDAVRLCLYGGYPDAFRANEPIPVLTRLLEAFVLRDASDLFRIRHLDAFRKLALLISRQTGQLVNTAEWASLCGVSRDTIDSYVDLLRESQLVHTVSPFAGGKRSELTRRPKLYFCDNGLYGTLQQSFLPLSHRPDSGALVEAFVAGELRKHLSPLEPSDTLRYWRSTSDAEVDFVVERRDGLHAFEVKASELQRPTLTRSAHSFIAAYAPARFTVVNLSLTADQDVGETRVQWRPLSFLEDPFA